MTVRARTEPNFKRARLSPRRRRRFRMLLSWNVLGRCLGVVLLVIGVHQSVSFVLTTPLLRVDRINVEGHVRLSTGQVQALIEDLRGTNILRADLARARERLAGSPWIANAALRRVLPSTVEVFVAERYPIALCRLGQELFLMDATGALLDEFGPQYAEFDLPIVDGLATVSGGRSVLDPRRVDLAARVVAALTRTPEIGTRLSQVDVSDPDDAIVLLDGDSALLHLGRERFLERVQGYLDLAGALREGVPDIDYVDLRFGRHVYVRPAAGGVRSPGRSAPRASGVRQF
jgi:cell division septal protein FtsQ